MSTKGKEIAKFACGFETFHTLMHAYFWLSETAIKLSGFEFGQAWQVSGIVIRR